MEKFLQTLQDLSKTAKTLLLTAISVVLLAVILLIVFSGSGEVTVSVESSLTEIITSSKISTAEYTYNSIAEIKDGDETKYYVSYKGTVRAGFDFENIQVVRTGKTIRIIVPDVKILEVLVDPELDYIFIKEKYDTESTYIEATEACKKDLLAKAQSNGTLLSTARSSAEGALMALIQPFENRLKEDETFEIEFKIVKEAGTK